MPFSHNGLKTTTGIYRYTAVKRLSQVNKYTLSYRFLYGNVHGLVFAKNRPFSLNWSDYTRQVLQPFGSGIIPVGMSDEFVTDQIPCLIEQHFTNMRRCIHEPSMHV